MAVTVQDKAEVIAELRASGGPRLWERKPKQTCLATETSQRCDRVEGQGLRETMTSRFKRGAHIRRSSE